MKSSTKLALVAAVSTLAACDSNTTVVPAAVEPVLTSSMLPGTLYTPIENDGEANPVEALSTTGIPGFIGNSDGTVSQALVRLNAERTIAYVSIDGGLEQEYSTRNYSYDGYPEYFWGSFSDGDATIYVDVYSYSDGPGYASHYRGDTYGSGYIGLETALADLPTGIAEYLGDFNMSGSTASMNGTMLMELDFASSGIDGVFIAGYGVNDPFSETSSSGAVTGQIAGSIDGGRIAGTAATTSGPEGSFDFMGAVYGSEGQFAAGGIAGTMTVGETDHTMGGQFYLSSDGYYYRYD